MATLKNILKRIQDKRQDYSQYGFTVTENDAFKTFFDLSQELGGMADFYRLCVAIPMGFFDLHSRLYIIDPKDNRFSLVEASEGKGKKGQSVFLEPSEKPYRTDEDTLVLSIRGNMLMLDQLPFKTESGVLGILEVYPAAGLDGHDELFFEKFANRIGYNVHNRFIVKKNIEHLKFIRTLVADIEHNVIAPNMVYNLFLRNLKGRIIRNQMVELQLSEHLALEQPDRAALERLLAEITEVNEGLGTELNNMERHYKNMSLFLETLLRRGHFDHGRLMLRTKHCNIKNDVLEPQLEQYRDRFRRLDIEINDRMSGVPEEDVISVVDVGLIAQVYSNLFSNAMKYTQPVRTGDRERKKYISYGRELIKDHFGQGKDGIKYNVFSTGPHLNPEEHDKIFQEGYRGNETIETPGTGHGLAFIKNVLELHNGEVGYEPTHNGNNFYFILPR
jgi:signal transduction histidine kinase